MLYKSVETYHPVSLPCKDTNILIFVTCGASFYLLVWSVQSPIQSLYPWARCIYVITCKNVLCTCSYIFYSHGCNKFLHARTLFTLADTTSILMFAMYLHARISVHLLHMSSSPMGEMSELETCFEPVYPNWFCDSWWFYCLVHSLIHHLFPWVQ